jgi:DNA-binding protein YbaB
MMRNKIDINRIASTSRRAAFISIAGLFIVVSSLSYSAFKLHSLTTQTQQTEQELGKKKTELADAEIKIEKAGEALHIPPNQLILLRDYAFKNLNPNDPGLPFLLEQMQEADKELKKIKNDSEDNRHRASITIRYYNKYGDRGSGDEAMEALKTIRGFKIEKKEPREPETPTNAIWLVSPGVSPEDVRLVAYTLIRVGIQIRHIGTSGMSPDPRFLRGIKGTLIGVGSDPKYLDNEVWTVSRIRQTSNFYVP